MAFNGDLTDIAAEHEAAILDLNNAHATELSWLDETRLRGLIGQAFHARQIHGAAGFLLALDESADYDSPNYLWFRQRHDRFVYVDRVAIHASARGRGLAKMLYSDLIARADAAGHTVILCEVNADPPNRASDMLHAALGFVAVGSAEIHGGLKTVRYLTRPVQA